MLILLTACTFFDSETEPEPVDPPAPAPIEVDLGFLDGCWVPPYVLEERAESGRFAPSTIGLCVRPDTDRHTAMWTDDRTDAFPGAMTLRFETREGVPRLDAFVAYKKVGDALEAVNEESRLSLAEARDNHASYELGTGFPSQMAFDRTGDRLTVSFSGAGPDAVIQLEMELALDEQRARMEQRLGAPSDARKKAPPPK